MNHLVIVTSMIKPEMDNTIFDTNERINQTKYTISTIKNHIPNATIVLLEGSSITYQFAVDKIFNYDISKCHKSQGEATLLLSFLKDNYDYVLSFDTLSKVSGRYYLTDNFKWDNLPLNKTIIDYVENSWLNIPCYNTRYYRIPKEDIEQFRTGLENYLTSSYCANRHPDIEHCFRLCNIINSNNVYSPDKLGVAGRLTGNGQYIED